MGQEMGLRNEKPKPDWYGKLNTNEKRIVDLFVRSGIFVILSKQYLVKVLCSKGGMDPRTLSERLKYLINSEPVILAKIKNERGAVAFCPRFIIETPELMAQIENVMKQIPAKATFIHVFKIPTDMVSRPEMIDSMKRSKYQCGVTWGASWTKKQIRQYNDSVDATIENERNQMIIERKRKEE